MSVLVWRFAAIFCAQFSGTKGSRCFVVIYFRIQNHANHATGVKLFQLLYNANSLVYESNWFLCEELYIELMMH